MIVPSLLLVCAVAVVMAAAGFAFVWAVSARVSRVIGGGR